MTDMDNIDQQYAKLKQMTIDKENLHSKLKKIEEQATRLKEKKEMLELEVEERAEHHKNLQELYDLETKNIKDKAADDQDGDLENAEEIRKGMKDVEKKVFEKLTFHMDKYYTYIEENIKLSIKKGEEQDDSEGYAPTQVQAVMVKCLKSAFPENAVEDDSEEDASVITLRLSKKSSFYDLKKACVYYWNLLSTAEKQQQEILDNENEQGNEEKKEEKTIQSSHTSIASIPLKQFELLFENSVVHDNEDLDRFITTNLQQAESQYFMLTLKRKKNKKKAHNSNKETKENGQSQLDPELKSMTQQQDKLESEKSKEMQASQKELDIIEEEENEDDQQDKINQERFAHSKLHKVYREFFSKLPYIRKYFVINDQDVLKIDQQKKDMDDIKKQKGFKFDDNNVCMVFLLFLLLLINIIYMNLLDNQSVFISHIKQLNKLLYVSPVNVDSTTAKKVYWNDISTFEELETYLMDYQGMPGQLFDKDSQLRKNYEIIGAFRFRQVRTKQISCPYPRRTERPSQVKCKSEQFNRDTQFTSQIQAGQFQWQNFMPVEKVSIGRTTVGKFNVYDSSGYILDIKKENQTVRAYQNLIVEEMIQNGYFTIETLAQFLTFTLRSTNDGSFFFIEFLLEYTSSGIFPKQPTIIPFSPNIYGTGTNSPTSVVGLTSPSPPTPPSDYNVGLRLEILDIFKILIGIFFILYVIVVIISTMGNQDQATGIDLTYFISLTFILNFLVIFTTFLSVSIAINHSSFNFKVTELQQEIQYIDLGDNAQVYNEILRSTSANVTVLMIRTVFLLSFFKSFEALITTIQSSYLQIFASFVMLIFVTIGFAFVGQSIWGYYIQSFSTFGEAVLSLLLITIGCFDLNKLLSTELSLSLTYLGSYYFFIYQFMFGIIAVLSFTFYSQTNRLTIIHMGIAQEKKWTIYHWFLWFFSWLPEKYKKKCYKAIGSS